MRSTVRLVIAIAVVGTFVLISAGQTQNDAVVAQGRKPFYITRFYTGPDGLSHYENVAANFAGSSPSGEIAKLDTVTEGAIHRAAPGTVLDWHPGPRRQYIVTLSGQGELEVGGGKKVVLGTGSVELIEDTTGKGHITRTVGNEDRVLLFLPIAGASGK